VITKKGVIHGVDYRFPSGIALMHVGDDVVYVESGYGLRSLAACFGAREGEGDLNEKIRGEEIVYSVDHMNVLCGFTPAGQWEGPEIPEEGIEEDEQESY